jgi:hypothetical protein
MKRGIYMARLGQVAAVCAVFLVLLLLRSFSALAAQPETFPKRILLPNGFQPEGIATGRGTDFFVGSLGRLADDGVTPVGGAIYKGDLRTGEGQVVVPSEAGKMALGLDMDIRSNYLFVAGGPFGNAFVYDAATGDPITEIELTIQPFFGTLVNDVIVTRQAAYFSDSFHPLVYRVPLGPGGAVPDPVVVHELPLGGDFVHVAGEINANGIVASPNGKFLIVINYFLGTLYRVELETGAVVQIDLGGDTMPFGDGLLLDGKMLYVMQNETNEIAVIELAPGLLTGMLVRHITDPDYFKVPTTIAEFGSDLYAVNARFDVAPPPIPGNPPADPNLEYDVIKVPKH